jgi:hypothetical protein
VTTDDDRRVQYLLGRLPEDEQETFERDALADDGRFEALLAAEDDLIDAYVAGGLSGEDARRFEARFLPVPARRERVEFARSLRRLVQAEVDPAAVAPRRPRTFSWLPVAASLAGLALGGWSVLRMQELSQALSRARGEQQALDRQLSEERARAAALAGDLAAAREGAGGITSWALEPGGEREPKGAPALVVPASAEWVRLRLRASEIPPQARLRVVLETTEGRRLAAQEGLRPRALAAGQAVDVMLPAALLAPGSYVLTLSGAPSEEVFAAYSLNVAEARSRGTP